MVIKISMAIVVALFLWGCEDVPKQDCNSAYKNFDYVKAAKLCKISCESNTYESCSLLGLMYENGEGVKKDEKLAVELLLKACSGDNSNGCFHLGTYYERTNKKKATQYYQKSCDLGNTLSCKTLEELQKQALAIDSEENIGLQLKCDDANASACYQLGNRHRKSNRPFEAANSYKKACNYNKKLGCSEYEDLRGEIVSLKKAEIQVKIEKLRNTVNKCKQRQDIGCQIEGFLITQKLSNSEYGVKWGKVGGYGYIGGTGKLYTQDTSFTSTGETFVWVYNKEEKENVSYKSGFSEVVRVFRECPKYVRNNILEANDKCKEASENLQSALSMIKSVR